MGPWAAAVAVALVFVGRDPGRLAAPFGPSHDGFNAALYMTGGRAMLEQGPLASRLGAWSETPAGDLVVYAHHPPVVYLAEAAALALTGTPELAARLPAVAASLVVLALVVLLLRAVGLPTGAAAVGLLFAFATPMFLVFGALACPDILGLAPMTALALLWQRARDDPEPSTAALAVLAALATLTSWPGGLFAACVALALLFIERRRRLGTAVLAGTAVSAVLVGLWILWSYRGDLGDFAQRAILRTGVSDLGGVSLRRTVRQQMQYFGDLFPIGGWLVVPLAALGLLDARTRVLMAASLGTMLGWALVFRRGAYDHSYWLYCMLLPLVLSAAVAADAGARWLRSRVAWSLPATAALGTALVVGLGITLWRPSDEQLHHRYAAAIGAEARAVAWPPAQRYAYALGGDGPTDLLPWVHFYSRRQPYGVDGPQSVPRGEILVKLADGRLQVVPGERAREP